MSDEETLAYKRGYSRGYNCRSYHRWPEHCPPEPPNEIIAALMGSAKALRDAVDGQLAILDERDEMAVTLGPLIDDLDEKYIACGKWIEENA